MGVAASCCNEGGEEREGGDRTHESQEYQPGRAEASRDNRGRYKPQSRRSWNDASDLADALRIWACAFPRSALPGLMKLSKFCCVARTRE
jgi:hypothetical protein